jgi:hypothetical protein
MASLNSASNQNSTAPSDESANQQFRDPGVSNGDVDWLFRGREVKKLTKRSNTINNEVQSQLLQAQQKALIQSKEYSTTSPTTSSISLQNLNDLPLLGSIPTPSASAGHEAGVNVNIATPFTSATMQTAAPVAIPTRHTDTPLKSSLKSSSISSVTSGGLKIDTSFHGGSPHSINSPLNDINNISLSHKSTATTNKDTVSTPSSNGANNPTTPTSGNRSRSSSVLFGRPKPSSVSEPKPQKKSFISSLSSKLKSSSSAKTQHAHIGSGIPAAAGIAPVSSPSSISKFAGLAGKGATIPPRPTTPTSTAQMKRNPTSSSTFMSTVSSTRESEVDQKLATLPFKRVCFALDQLVEDPQQQIPSRRPKRGNVLIPEDMMAPPPKLSIGITNSHNEQTKDMKPRVDPKVYEEAVLRHRYFQQESLKHSQEAHVAAVRMAKEVSSFKKRKGSFLRSDDEDDEDDEENITDSRFLNNDDHLDIDTPLHEHVNYFGSGTGDDDNNGDVQDAASTEVSLETLYTRCCHLREILPIPATLKQLKDKSKPLHVLKMLNPKPTLIDVLSFSDFLAITPIITVIFDNVTIDTEMFKIVLISLKDSTMLDKLSLRNVPIDAEGWKYLCKFLKSNKSIQKLDISQQRLKKSSDSTKSVVRSQLDWDLFTDTIAARGGIEELVIHGCSLSTPQFDNLVNKALILKTKRLGLASSQLDAEKMAILSKWIASPSSTCTGVDFAFNDLSQGQLGTLNDTLAEKGPGIQLQYFSLNSTNVNVDECANLIKNLSLLPSLKFLDLSNNSQIFPNIITTLRDYLPKYPDLRRLHFDFDDLEDVSIIQLCLIFQQCPKLVHVSFLGNSKMTSRCAVALYSAVKNSHIYNMDMDYEGFDEELVSRMAFYLMRNMEAFLNTDEYGVISSPQKADAASERSAAIAKDEDLIFDGSLITKAAEHLLESESHIIVEERMIMYRSLVQKTVRLRTEIHNAMNILFAIREKGTLSIEGKENLLRFCLLDDSLENILDIFSDEISKSLKSGAADDADSKTHRPDMIRRLSSQLTRHMSSEDIMQTGPIISDDFYQHQDELVPVADTEAPHIVVADADSVPVDSTTGKRVLMRHFSQTGVYSKKLEEEEGEFHRWGFFVQQQNDIMPDDSQAATRAPNDNDRPRDDLAKKEEHEKEKEKEKERIRIEAEKAEQERVEKLKLEQEKRRLKINNIPSGAELRETIMKAKGIERISDLIKKVNKDFSTVEKIYKHVDTKRTMNGEKEGVALAPPSSTRSSMETPAVCLADEAHQVLSPGAANGRDDSGIIPDTPNMDVISENSLSPTVSINSFSGGDLTGQADEVYDKLLNDIIRVRSNK